MLAGTSASCKPVPNDVVMNLIGPASLEPDYHSGKTLKISPVETAT